VKKDVFEGKKTLGFIFRSIPRLEMMGYVRAMFVSKSQFVRDLKDKDRVSSPFLVKFSAVGTDKNGKAFMNVVLMDRTGELEARIWDDVLRYAASVVRDQFIHVEGRVQSYQGRKQLVISSVQALREDEVEEKDYVAEGTLDVESLYSELLGFVASMRDPYYRGLCEATLRDDPEIADRVKRAPAAKSVHHAYRGGLLEHVVSICRILDSLASHYGKVVDRDLLLLGGFFHDIGKIWELSYDRTTDYTTEGKLIGHLVMGTELIDRKIAELESAEGRLPGKFPMEKRLLAKHVVLAHHGQLEYGSPKRPKCLEALIVHYVDDLDSKVNAISKFIEADPSPGEWTQMNKMYGRFFFKGEAFREDGTASGNSPS
jgi:3'-5' exoribonuclease